MRITVQQDHGSAFCHGRTPAWAAGMGVNGLGQGQQGVRKRAFVLLMCLYYARPHIGRMRKVSDSAMHSNVALDDR